MNRVPLHGNSGVSFSTVGATAPISGTNAQPNNRPDITCHQYFANTCAKVKGLDSSTLQLDEGTIGHGFQFLNDRATTGYSVSEGWILLNSGCRLQP